MSITLTHQELRALVVEHLRTKYGLKQVVAADVVFFTEKGEHGHIVPAEVRITIDQSDS